MERVLIVKLGALGDIVHALPTAAALRDAAPAIRISWLVDARNRAMLDLATGVDEMVVLGDGRSPTTVVAPGAADGAPRTIGPFGWMRAIRWLRAQRFDAALDLQGLIKSAVLARASGARRVIGFSVDDLREGAARMFYTDVREAPRDAHVIEKGLSLLRAIGVEAPASPRFPIRVPPSRALTEARAQLGAADAPFALINPGAAWPNKRWAPERFGAVARALASRAGLRTIALWGPGEEALAYAVVAASDGAAIAAPPTSIADVLALSQAASVVISGDTGPLHLAAAVGAPTVGIFGPTNPARNGPWRQPDSCASRFAACTCHYERACRRGRACLDDVAIDEVTKLAELRLKPAPTSA